MDQPFTLTASSRAGAQFVRYAVVGLASNLLLYLGYLGLCASGVGAKSAMTVIYICGVASTFAFNRRWTFGYRGQDRTTFIRYAAAYLIGYGVNLAALHVLVDRMGLAHEAVQAVLIFSIAALVFTLQKFWVFPRVHDPKVGEP